MPERRRSLPEGADGRMSTQRNAADHLEDPAAGVRDRQQICRMNIEVMILDVRGRIRGAVTAQVIGDQSTSGSEHGLRTCCRDETCRGSRTMGEQPSGRFGRTQLDHGDPAPTPTDDPVLA
jgi:hypothetical protein